MNLLGPTASIAILNWERGARCAIRWRTLRDHTTGTSKELALAAVDAALTKNAMEPILLRVAEQCDYTDYVLVVSGRSGPQVEAIAAAIQSGLKALGHDSLGREGDRRGQWILLDFNDLVVHVFYHPIREHYDLEGLWADAEKVQLEVPPELRHAAVVYG